MRELSESMFTSQYMYVKSSAPTDLSADKGVNLTKQTQGQESG